MTTPQLSRLDINKALIGFDRIFDDMERRYAHSVQSTYPPYNILKTGELDYIIEVAVTGFSKDEITVEVNQEQLIITADRKSKDENVEYLHRGLAARSFERIFTLEGHMEVHEASVADGLLRVHIKRIIPEALKPRQIEVKG